MVARLWQVSLLICMLLLAGCFQQAGESLQAIDSTADPAQSNLDPTPTLPVIDATPQLVIATTTPQDEDASAPGTTTTSIPTQPASGPTLPPITVIVQPTNAPITPTDSDDPTPINLSGESGFITPVSPMGAAIETSQPESSTGGTTAATPSGLITPTDLFSESATTNTNTSTATEGECTYTIESGDTVYRIALEHNTTVAAMREANPDLTGDNPVIQPGDVLILPSCDEDVMVEATPTDIPPIITPAVGPGSNVQQEIYTVQPGDTLFVIAQRFGTTVGAIVELNELANPNRLSVGQELLIPGS